VAFRRHADHEADRALKKLLKGLSGDQTVSVIRAFTYFSHLANLAEDRHHIRRRACTSAPATPRKAASRWRWRACAGPASRRGHLADAGRGLCVAGAHRPPDRGAAQEHPGRRARHRAAAGRARRDQGACRAADALAPRELAANEAQIRARVLQLWQTRLLRFTKLTVADEIENALSYYEATFLREIPKLYADPGARAGPATPVASFLRMGQWIGGDRDGNPNVSAQTLEYALRRQSRSGAAPLPDRSALLGSELSMSAMLVGCTPAMQALAERSPDGNEHRQDEPYRRALTGMYARLAATLKA
jgi:phosphoenolpyruvate carboxylase